MDKQESDFLGQSAAATDEPWEPTTCEGTDTELPYCSGAECPRFSECSLYGFRLPR